MLVVLVSLWAAMQPELKAFGEGLAVKEQVVSA
jgi:hypothetical protein